MISHRCAQSRVRDPQWSKKTGRIAQWFPTLLPLTDGPTDGQSVNRVNVVAADGRPDGRTVGRSCEYAECRCCGQTVRATVVHERFYTMTYAQDKAKEWCPSSPPIVKIEEFRNLACDIKQIVPFISFISLI